jgi:tRNA(Ile)-lysidine synthase
VPRGAGLIGPAALRYLLPVLPRDVTTIREAVADALALDGRVVLAVSGGLDSMVLLDAAAHAIEGERLIVATFDHGTGSDATAASALVVHRARVLGLECSSGRAVRSLRSEAELRSARWDFLRLVATDAGARVCTAHTASDQVETVLMRLLRGAGPRGLAGLNGGGDVVRPLLPFMRSVLERYSSARELRWVEDPSNASRRFLRNRVRHDLLPALRQVRPSIDDDLITIGRDAGRWRADVEAAVSREIATTVRGDGALDVAAQSLEGRSRAVLAMMWPAIAARVGLVLDRRGIERLAAFTLAGRVGSRVQLSGGWSVIRSREQFEVRRALADADRVAQTLTTGAQIGPWAFRIAEVQPAPADLWWAFLPADKPLSVRVWHPGDAIAGRAGARPRKVKQCLSAAGVTGNERRGWPVVLAGDDIVWIPGVRRSEGATARPGWPGLPFVCENRSR